VLDAWFRTTVPAATRNRVIVVNPRRLHIQLHLFRVRHNGAVAESAIEEHPPIVEAIERRDRVAAEPAMPSQIDPLWSRLSDVLHG
jgi:DNA-binding GntR family transcriptional regulator